MRTLFLSIILLATLSFAALADQIVLKNGDRLTGSIVKFDGKNLMIKSELAGDVTIGWSAIQQVTSNEQLHVALSNGQTAVGPMTTSDGKIEVVTQGRGTVVTPKEEIVLIRNDAEQSAYDKSLNPGILESWEGAESTLLSRSHAATAKPRTWLWGSMRIARPCMTSSAFISTLSTPRTTLLERSQHDCQRSTRRHPLRP